MAFKQVNPRQGELSKLAEGNLKHRRNRVSRNRLPKETKH